MKYFIDTEFIEGLYKPLFGKERHFIDLVSIGVTNEDNLGVHFISNEYNYDNASEWVKENVIHPLYAETVHGDARNRYTAKNFHYYYGHSNKHIAEALSVYFHCWRDHHFWRVSDNNIPEIYGYYADYDWVLFCSLFGKMIDLPKGFPMYCRDLKQMLDELYTYQENKYVNETRLESWLKFIKNHPLYPKQEKEHNALDDAMWNKNLYDFITHKKFLLQKSDPQGVVER